MTTDAKARAMEFAISTWPEPFVGGMHVGMSKGVRVVHISTGIAVTCDHYRSQHQNRDAAIRAIEAALAQSAQQAGAVPEGWVLVPLEMTDEMAVAFIEGSPSVRKAWQDAIAAAPPALSDGRQG